MSKHTPAAPAYKRTPNKALLRARRTLFIEFAKTLNLDPKIWYRYSIDFLPVDHKGGVLLLAGEVLSKAYPATAKATGATE